MKFEQIDSMIEKWKKDEPLIADLFKQRKKDNAKVYMVNHIANLKACLLSLNKLDEKIDSFQHLIKEFTYKPINLEERLAFMELRPNHYHSFIQLRECFQELEKLEAKAMIKGKN